MPSRQLPASIRYLKAQLRILQRPTVWVSASVLLVAIVFLTETWNNPERFTAPSQPVGEELNPGTPDAAAPVRPAPLDPLSSADEPLFGSTTPDSSASPSSSAAGLPNSDRADSLDSPLLLPRSSTSRSTASPLAPDPFASVRSGSSASAGSGSSGSSGGSTNNPYSGSGLSGNTQNPFSSSASDRSSDSASPNPLQSALDRYATPSATSQPSSSPSPQSSSLSPSMTPSENSSGELQTPTAPLGQPSFVQPQPLPGQPSYGQTQPQPQFVPQTSPAPGTTGYTMPPAFRTNTNTSGGRSFGNYNNTPSGVPTTGFSSSNSSSPGTSTPTVQPQGAQPSASPAPFSVPRATPGQPIGGGQINTFSNP